MVRIAEALDLEQREGGIYFAQYLGDGRGKRGTVLAKEPDPNA